MGVRRNFSTGWNVDISFIISKLLTISVPYKFYTEQIFVLVSMVILGLSKSSFQWITSFVNYIINTQIQSYQIFFVYHFQIADDQCSL